MSKELPVRKFFVDRVDLREGDPFLPPGRRRRTTSYLEAACREALGLSEEEDCYELRLLRLFRDEYVVQRSDIEGSVTRHQEESTQIARAIERLPASAARDAYLDIHERGVLPIVALILDGRWDEAYEAYNRMHRDQKVRFLKIGKPAG